MRIEQLIAYPELRTGEIIQFEIGSTLLFDTMEQQESTEIDGGNTRTGSDNNDNATKNDAHEKITNNNKKRKSDEAKAKKKDDASLELIWICVECKEAECVTHRDSPLLVCEGPCKRPFHYPCAGLACVPPVDEQWVCSDCLSGRHMCCVCNQYGDDGADVHKCDRRDCGLFYHEACLSMFDVDVQVVTSFSTNNGNNNVIPVSENGSFDTDLKIENMNNESSDGTGNTSTIGQEKKGTNESSQLLVTTETAAAASIFKQALTKNFVNCPKFICPAHSCWTCSGGPPPKDQSCDGNCISLDNRNEVSNNQKKGKNTKGRKKKQKKNTIDAAFCEKKEKGLFVSLTKSKLKMFGITIF